MAQSRWNGLTDFWLFLLFFLTAAQSISAWQSCWNLIWSFIRISTVLEPLSTHTHITCTTKGWTETNRFDCGLTFPALKVQKITVLLSLNHSDFMTALRNYFPIVGHGPFDLCSVDGRKNVLDIPREFWTPYGLRTLARKRSAIYIRPRVCVTCHVPWDYGVLKKELTG